MYVYDPPKPRLSEEMITKLADLAAVTTVPRVDPKPIRDLKQSDDEHVLVISELWQDLYARQAFAYKSYAADHVAIKTDSLEEPGQFNVMGMTDHAIRANDNLLRYLNECLMTLGLISGRQYEINRQFIDHSANDN